MEYQRVTKLAQKGQSQTPSSSLRQTSLHRVRAHPLLELQRTTGNQAALNMQHSRNMQTDTTAQAFVEPRISHDFSRIPIHSAQVAVPQTKLKMNQPGDVYEQEADQVAEQVMRMTDTESSVSEDEDETKSHLMRKQKSVPRASTATDLPNVPPIVHTVLSNGGGQPLDTTTRAFMEPSFGHDFSQVRVHTNERAAESAQAVNALAYTVGRNVVFGQGQYTPGMHEGQRLLAHELTHTIQQGADRAFNPAVQRMRLLSAGGGLIQRDSDASTSSSVSEAPSLDEQYNTALQAARQTGNWQDAAEKLNAFNHEDIQLRLAQLTVDEVGYLHQGALDNPRVGPQSQVAQLTEPGTPLASTAPPTSTQVPPVSATEPLDNSSPTVAPESVEDMTDTEKLVEAFKRANIAKAEREKLAKVFSPEAFVVAILVFMGAIVAAQFTPVGWAADLAGLLLTAFFVETALISAIKHLINFADARNATTIEQLDQAGAEFAAAVAEIEVDGIILFLTHGIGGASEGGVPFEGPPPTGLVFAQTSAGNLLPVVANTIPVGAISAETAAQLGIGLSAVGGTLVLMSQVSGPGGGGSGGGSKPKVPDIPSGLKDTGEFGSKIMKWGNGDAEARARIATLTREELQSSGVTKEMAEAWRDFYQQINAKFPKNPSAAGRMDLMQKAVELLSGG